MAHPYKGKLYSHLKSLLPKLFLNILIHKTRRLTKIIYGKILICFLKNSIQKKKNSIQFTTIYPEVRNNCYSFYVFSRVTDTGVLKNK